MSSPRPEEKEARDMPSIRGEMVEDKAMTWNQSEEHKFSETERRRDGEGRERVRAHQHSNETEKSTGSHSPFVSHSSLEQIRPSDFCYQGWEDVEESDDSLRRRIRDQIEGGGEDDDLATTRRDKGVL